MWNGRGKAKKRGQKRTFSLRIVLACQQLGVCWAKIGNEFPQPLETGCFGNGWESSIPKFSILHEIPALCFVFRSLCCWDPAFVSFFHGRGCGSGDFAAPEAVEGSLTKNWG